MKSGAMQVSQLHTHPLYYILASFLISQEKITAAAAANLSAFSAFQLSKWVKALKYMDQQKKELKPSIRVIHRGTKETQTKYPLVR